MLTVTQKADYTGASPGFVITVADGTAHPRATANWQLQIGTTTRRANYVEKTSTPMRKDIRASVPGRCPFSSELAHDETV